MNRFDKLNANWLLLGTGDMYLSEKKHIDTPVSSLVNDISGDDIFMVRSEEQPPYGNYPRKIKEEVKVEGDKATDKENTIIKIIEVYSDKTFRVFLPR